MNQNSDCCELQQLVQKERSEELLTRGGEATPPSTPVKSNHPSDGETLSSHTLQHTMWDNNVQASSIISKESSSQATISQASMSGRAFNLSYVGNQSRPIHANDKERQKPIRMDLPRMGKQQKEVPDVRHMEQALLQLLEDFHSGNLRAFGKDCSMEQMTEIREQQEKLARLHFEMGQRQDIHEIEQSSFRQSSANMLNLLQRLEQLSVCIEQLHSK
ncbi:PREDICTED: uncharacterized protein LOC105363121 isoform X2 [Ceratosolen solmsi marchali]|uniref:Uncharacterized protein LOC105363121 isoform X2 n=1 Tax=Ceratosolen solmsi marchali TaxID=326594 RepID=A0AAJ7DWI5_9HYME|nr:PREDICTED: uncharacterized protein LOC105363121 isoform X2 [Ceratosolen solmsi marchali]